MKKLIVGVMGGGEGASPEVCELAYKLGGLIADQGWVLLNGGWGVGVMDASARGAKEHNGLTVGILPDRNKELASAYIDIPIVTGMGDGRNFINILSSDIVVALPGRSGTISEIALALKNGKNVILLNFPLGDLFVEYQKAGIMVSVNKPEEVIATIKKLCHLEDPDEEERDTRA
ncbi:MAG TPA: TIGR00725 family protein [Capillibacterium sp.]